MAPRQFEFDGPTALGGTEIGPVATNQLPGGLPPEWNTGTLSLGGGVGNFGGEIIGRVRVPYIRYEQDL